MNNLSEENVHEIRQRIESGETQVDIARKFGVSPATISDIKKGRSWGKLEERKSRDTGLRALVKENKAEREDWWPTKVSEIKERLNMSAKHYRMLAGLIHRTWAGVHPKVFVQDLMDILEEDNPRFDREVFLKACKGEENK